MDGAKRVSFCINTSVLFEVSSEVKAREAPIAGNVFVSNGAAYMFPFAIPVACYGLDHGFTLAGTRFQG